MLVSTVQKSPAQLSLYKSDTTEEPLRRHRRIRYYQVLSSHSGQVGKLLLMMFPPHQRVCVVDHLLDFHVHLKLGFPFDRGHVEIHGCGTHTQEFVQIATMLDLSIRVSGRGPDSQISFSILEPVGFGSSMFVVTLASGRSHYWY